MHKDYADYRVIGGDCDNSVQNNLASLNSMNIYTEYTV